MKRRDEANEAEEGEDHAAVEVGVEGEQPAVVHHVRQVALQVDGVEGAHRAGAKAKQSAAQRKVHLSIDAGTVASSERGTGSRTQ